MTEFEIFQSIITGIFDNKRQIEQEKKNGNLIHPEAMHRNAICNNKISNLPPDFSGIFVIEESYYTDLTTQKKTVLPHLFLFTENKDAHVTLTSYEIPKEYSPADFTNINPSLHLDYKTLTPSKKFAPMTYEYQPESFYGQSFNELAPSLTLYLEETLTYQTLKVTEILKRGDRVVIGYDGPIIYERIS